MNPSAIGYIGSVTVPLLPGSDVGPAARAEMCAVGVPSGVMLGCSLRPTNGQAAFSVPIGLSRGKANRVETVVSQATKGDPESAPSADPDSVGQGQGPISLAWRCSRHGPPSRGPKRPGAGCGSRAEPPSAHSAERLSQRVHAQELRDLAKRSGRGRGDSPHPEQVRCRQRYVAVVAVNEFSR